MKTSRSTKAFSMIDLLLIIAAVVGIAFVILPWLARARAKGSSISCANSLKQTTFSFLIWAGDNNDLFPMQVSTTNGGVMELASQGSAYAVFLIMSNELNTPKVLFCPKESNPKRRMASVFDSTVPPSSSAGIVPFTPTNNLSFFVGLDAMQTNAQTILTGDDNLMLGKVRARPVLWFVPTNAPLAWTKERHINQGYFAIADGSVQSLTTAALSSTLYNTGLITNRLAMP